MFMTERLKQHASTEPQAQAAEGDDWDDDTGHLKEYHES